MVPKGWKIELEGDTALVVGPADGPGFAVVHQHARGLPERLLFALAAALTSRGCGTCARATPDGRPSACGACLGCGTDAGAWRAAR